MKILFLTACIGLSVLSAKGQKELSPLVQSDQKEIRTESVEELIDKGTWIVTFTRLSEEQGARLSYRDLDRRRNFLLIDSGTYVLQVVTKGAQPIGKHTPEEQARLSSASYPPAPGNNGMGGYTLKGKMKDVKKKIDKKGHILFTYIMEDWGRSRVSISIDPATGQTHISIPSLYRMSGQAEPYRAEEILIGNIVGRY